MRRVNIHRGASQHYDEVIEKPVKADSSDSVADPDQFNLGTPSSVITSVPPRVYPGSRDSDGNGHSLTPEHTTDEQQAISKQIGKPIGKRIGKQEIIGKQKGKHIGKQKVSDGIGQDAADDPIGKQKVSTLVSKREAKGKHIGKQKGKHIGKQKWAFSELVGLERSAILLVADSVSRQADGVSERMTAEFLASILNTTHKSIKTLFARLRQKQILEVVVSKRGRGGWANFRLSPEIFHDCRRCQLVSAKVSDTENQNFKLVSTKVSKWEAHREADSSSSSSYINNNFKPTTTAETHAHGWALEDLDYSMLTDIGFGRSQVLQLRSLRIPFDVLQRSLVHFEFELRYTESGKSIKEPLALLMKRLRQNGCWEAPEEYQKRIKHFQNKFEESEKELQTIQPNQQQDINQSDTAM